MLSLGSLVTGGYEDLGDADITVIETLAETIVKLDKSVVGRSPRKCVGRSEQQRQSQYTPTWLNINIGTLSEVMEYGENSDVSEAITNFNQFCWQGQGGTKVCPMLPPNLTDIRGYTRKTIQPPYQLTHHHLSFQASANLTEVDVTGR